MADFEETEPFDVGDLDSDTPAAVVKVIEKYAHMIEDVAVDVEEEESDSGRVAKHYRYEVTLNEAWAYPYLPYSARPGVEPTLENYFRAESLADLKDAFAKVVRAPGLPPYGAQQAAEKPVAKSPAKWPPYWLSPEWERHITTPPFAPGYKFDATALAQLVQIVSGRVFNSGQIACRMLRHYAPGLIDWDESLDSQSSNRQNEAISIVNKLFKAQTGIESYEKAFTRSCKQQYLDWGEIAHDYAGRIDAARKQGKTPPVAPIGVPPKFVAAAQPSVVTPAPPPPPPPPVSQPMSDIYDYDGNIEETVAELHNIALLYDKAKFINVLKGYGKAIKRIHIDYYASILRRKYPPEFDRAVPLQAIYDDLTTELFDPLIERAQRLAEAEITGGQKFATKRGEDPVSGLKTHIREIEDPDYEDAKFFNTTAVINVGPVTLRFKRYIPDTRHGGTEVQDDPVEDRLYTFYWGGLAPGMYAAGMGVKFSTFKPTINCRVVYKPGCLHFLWTALGSTKVEVTDLMNPPMEVVFAVSRFFAPEQQEGNPADALQPAAVAVDLGGGVRARARMAPPPVVSVEEAPYYDQPIGPTQPEAVGMAGGIPMYKWPDVDASEFDALRQRVVHAVNAYSMNSPKTAWKEVLAIVSDTSDNVMLAKVFGLSGIPSLDRRSSDVLVAQAIYDKVELSVFAQAEAAGRQRAAAQAAQAAPPPPAPPPVVVAAAPSVPVAPVGTPVVVAAAAPAAAPKLSLDVYGIMASKGEVELRKKLKKMYSDELRPLAKAIIPGYSPSPVVGMTLADVMVEDIVAAAKRPRSNPRQNCAPARPRASSRVRHVTY